MRNKTMAYLKIVPKEDWEVLDKYIHDGANVILVPEEALSQELRDIAPKIRDMEGPVDYDFGGEPDACVDFLFGYHSWAACGLGFEAPDGKEDEE